jgi:hypothetical protein
MVDDILRRVKDAVLGNDQTEGNYDRPRPASEDPYGDPADQPGEGQFGNVRPASEDPYGDPADQVAYGGQNAGFGDVRPASEDPYGDPADEETQNSY